MRIAAVSDIHGNLRALEAVLADLRSQAPDVVVNLGDHLSGPLEAAATCDLLMSQAGWVHIRGNHDRQLTSDGKLGLSDAAAHQELTDKHLRWLRELRPTTGFGEDVFLCHGTPECDTEYLLEEVSSSGVELMEHDGVRALTGTLSGLILCGHSHVPRVVRLYDGTVVVNPGSVGLQAYDDPDHRYPHSVENGSPHARYTIIDRSARGWVASLRVLEYDWDGAARLARAQGRADWAHALATGYAAR